MALSERLINLQLLEFKYSEPVFELKYCEDKKMFNISPSYIRVFVDYNNTVITYNTATNIKFSHMINCNIKCNSIENIENYIGEFRNEFVDFDYSSETKGLSNYYYFKKSNITHNFELNTELHLQYNEYDCTVTDVNGI